MCTPFCPTVHQKGIINGSTVIINQWKFPFTNNTHELTPIICWEDSVTHNTERSSHSASVIVIPGGTQLWLGRGCAARTSGPLPILRVKNVPMFRDFAPKMDPCLGILLQKQAIFFLIFGIFFLNGPMFRDFEAKNGTHV